jgi:hypothetical protein
MSDFLLSLMNYGLSLFDDGGVFEDFQSSEFKFVRWAEFFENL